MSVFKINTPTLEISELNEYHFKSEGNDKISPQEILARYPQMILSIPELELPPSSSELVVREFSTNRGSIDILIITENADIVLIETKLFKNPESHRTVVAQAIDYVKAFTDTDIETLKARFLQSKYANNELTESLFTREDFCLVLKKNIKNGNYIVLIVGDKIHTNILGMVESIHSAPHLAFTIYLVELSPIRYDESNILLRPSIIENTSEVERSVIRLEVDLKKESYLVESSTPSKEGKGSSPIINEEQFLSSLSNPSFAETIKSFWNKWRSIGGDIRFGTVGFSAGFKVGEKRIPIQFVMNTKIDLISDKYRHSYNLPDNAYKIYKESLKTNVPKAFDLLVANHIVMYFSTLSKDELEYIFEATIVFVQEMKED